MLVWTRNRVFQFYIEFLDSSVVGSSGGHVSAGRWLLPGNPALPRLTQQARFPSTTLKPGATTQTTTIYQFTTD